MTKHNELFSHSVQWFSLWDVYRYQPISHSSCSLNWNARQLCHVWPHRVIKYKRCSFFVWYGKMQHMFHESSVRLKAHTLFMKRVLYFPISHSNEHRLHIVTVLASFYSSVSEFWCAISLCVFISLRFYAMTFLRDRERLTGLNPEFSFSKERYLYWMSFQLFSSSSIFWGWSFLEFSIFEKYVCCTKPTHTSTLATCLYDILPSIDSVLITFEGEGGGVIFMSFKWRLKALHVSWYPFNASIDSGWNAGSMSSPANMRHYPNVDLMLAHRAQH